VPAATIAYALDVRPIALMAVLLALALVPAQAAASSNATATSAYIRADAKLVQTAAARIGAARGAIADVVAKVQSECPRGAAGSPQDPESTEVSNEVIGLMVTSALRGDAGAIRAFVHVVSPLRWSSHATTAAVQGYVGQLRTLSSLPEPPLCTDVRAWSTSGFHTLAADTAGFSPRFMGAWVAIGEIPAGVSRYASGEGRTLARRAAAHEEALSEFEAGEVETWGSIMNELELHP
jgi:hypothetical protein